MDKIIYGFIFWLLFFALFESSELFMFSKCFSETSVPELEKIEVRNLNNHFDDAANSYYRDRYKALASNQEVHFGDLVLNEVMADPTPVVKLPNAEFIELRNNSSFPVNIKNWVIEVNGKQKILPDYLVGVDSLIILTGNGGEGLFDSYGTNLVIAGLSFPNAGFDLKLYSAENFLIDSLIYTPGMHSSGFSDGGYSLERIDPRRWCGAGANWKTSMNANGGTPGTENSLFRDNRDNTPPSVVSVEVVNPALLEVVISETPEGSSIAGALFSFLPSLPPPDSIRFDPGLKKYFIYFPKGSILNGVSYDLIINGLTDECGNRAEIIHRGFWYYLPKRGDLLISEVLFHPNPQGVDFVEIFNQSGHQVRIDELYLASLDGNQKIKSVYPLSIVPEVLSDGQYGAFTSDPVILLSNYNSLCPECIFGMEMFPPYNSDEGWVVIVNREMEILDEFHYLEQMHNPLLGDVRGVSLERNSFSKATDDPSNWLSASATVGFATPGYRNSAAGVVGEKNQIVHIEPRIFSPNGDGINDRLQITLSPGEPGHVVNIRIYNESGIEIRRLTNNLMIGSHDVVEWDGTNDNNQRVNLGIYLVLVDLFDLQSGTSHFKSACVVTDRLE